MKKHEISLTAEQAGEVLAPIVGVVLNMRPERAQYWIGRKKKLANEIGKILIGGEKNPYADLIAKCEQYSKEVYGKKQDFSGIIVPEAEEIFSWITPVPGAEFMTVEEIYYGIKNKLHPAWKWTNKPLDDALDFSFGRDGWKDNYAVRFCPNHEADEDLKNLSANDIAERKISAATIKERLWLGGFLYWSEKIILDRETITLCAGSRCSGGVVPSVGWSESYGVMSVRWYSPDDTNDLLRSRVAVS